MSVVTLLLLFVFYNGVVEIKADDSSTGYQDVMNNLISRLGAQKNNNSDNLVFMPPTFSVDIVSLLRWAVENTQHVTSNRNSRAGTERKDIKTKEYFYPTHFMPLRQFNGKSYFFSKNQKFSWSESLSFCRSFGMDLISVETKEENDFLIQEIETLGLTNNWFWISANKIGRSAYVWINGEQMIYDDWAPKQPDNAATENCIVLASKNWYDVPCQTNSQHTYEGNFVCEER